VADHPYFGDKLDAYALTGFLLGRTERITGMVTVTNLPSRPAPVLARTVTSLSALSGGGDPVTFDGEFYHVDGLDPAAAPAPRVFTGSVGPKSLAVTGQLADGWIAPGGSDWLSQLYLRVAPPRRRRRVRSRTGPADIADVFNFGGRITPEPLAATRGEDGRWIAPRRMACRPVPGRHRELQMPVFAVSRA
jgi:alkanesulfonate monooxygenase SsuD/methylene tetrahydromethanopterin reductase-like flavin-dependent oxidoreductase (luciferase family)